MAPSSTKPSKAPDKVVELGSPHLDLSDGEASSEHSDDEGTPQDKSKAGDASRETSAVPLQKRRRVTRACDECRRKKIKCDGKQPCTHCQVYSYECTYDKPSNRRRNPAPQYIEALESRLQRAESLLRKFMPDVDLSDPGLDPAVQQEFRLREQARMKALKKDDATTSSAAKSEERLLSMISGVGQLEFDDKGDYDFHGPSSGTVFFRRMKDHFKSLLGRDYHVPVLPRPPKPSGVLNLDSPRLTATGSSGGRKGSSSMDVCDLPPKVIARRLCSYSLKNATCLLRIVHIPTFYTMVDNIYERPPGKTGTYGTDEDRNLALLYSVMALGCMYNVADDKESKKPPYEVATEHGMKYYTSARFLLQDITECRDLTSLQALLFMILFVQSISNLSTCYGFVGIALRSALRMGLHRNLPHSHDTVIDLESRRRVFSVCRQLDIYVSAILGFPMLLNDEDIDQPLPTPIDDEYLNKSGMLPIPAGTTSFFEAFNAHARLMDILSKIIKNIYPLKGMEQTAAESGQVKPSFMISYAQVKEMEAALQQWNEDLPVAWRPDSDGPEEVVRVRNLLRFAYAHVQMVLYRPFLHAVSPKMTAGKMSDERSYALGAAGINVARNIIHIGIEMRKQVSLVGPYWFTLFTEFFAIITLVFYVLENENKPGTAEIMADAVAGRDMINTLARRTVAADRISKALEVFFEQLPDDMKKMDVSSGISRKRSAGGSKDSKPKSLSAPGIDGQKTRADEPIDRDQDMTVSGVGSSAAIAGPSMSFDLDTSFGLDDFSPVMQGMSPLDLSATPSDNATPSHSDPAHHNASTQAMNQIHQLDAIMFPSGDPLAYPSQPGMEFGGGMQHHNPTRYYMPNHFDGIEGQLMGPLPPYMMPTQAQSSFAFPAQWYTDPMLALQMQRPPQQPHTPHQMPQQPQRRRMFNQFGNPTWPGMFSQYD